MENNVNAQSDIILGIVDDSKNYMYKKLWNLCAGPLCDLPEIGEKVYYFSQGHVELVEASTREELDQRRPIFDLPSKLLCRVIDVKRKVDQKSDEVYAEISLEPDTAQVTIPTHNDDQERTITHSFVKVLSASDTSKHSGLSLLKRHAIECLSPLDMAQQVPSQKIVVKDLHGQTWTFKHSFRGTPQRHLFTTGWTKFLTDKKLVAKDSFVFVSGENGEMRAGVRRARHNKDNESSAIVSTETMQHGVIASAVNAFKNQCSFTVVYMPRSKFVVGYDKFVDVMNNKFNIGSRFKMRFENEDFCEKGYSGTVVGVNDFSPHWKDSEWRSLQVQWDDFASFPRPNKVSPWEIEHLMMPTENVLQSAVLFKKKRSRQVYEIGSTSSNLRTPPLRQDQDIGQPSMGTVPSGWLMNNSVPIMPEPNNNNNQMVLPMKEKITTDATTSCMLFGVDLAETKDHTGPLGSCQKSEISKLAHDKKLDHTKTLTSPKEVQSKQFNYTRSRTKVQKQGVAIGRAVDSTALNGYKELIKELENIFDIKGELQTRNKWEIVYTDNEGDIMLLGDEPWPEFCNMVKKIYIRSKEEVKKRTSENKTESTIVTSADVTKDT